MTLRSHLRAEHCWEQEFIDTTDDDALVAQHAEAHELAAAGNLVGGIAYPHDHPRDRFEELLAMVGLDFTLGRGQS